MSKRPGVCSIERDRQVFAVATILHLTDWNEVKEVAINAVRQNINNI
jgi:hypothetical protein